MARCLCAVDLGRRSLCFSRPVRTHTPLYWIRIQRLDARPVWGWDHTCRTVPSGNGGTPGHGDFYTRRLGASPCRMVADPPVHMPHASAGELVGFPLQPEREPLTSAVGCQSHTSCFRGDTVTRTDSPYLMRDQDHYEVLGVPVDADQAAIKAAHRDLIKKHHPDLNPGDPDANHRTASINVAYEVLSNPMRRADFNLRRRAASRQESTRASSHPHSHQHRTTTSSEHTDTRGSSRGTGGARSQRTTTSSEHTDTRGSSRGTGRARSHRTATHTGHTATGYYESRSDRPREPSRPTFASVLGDAAWALAFVVMRATEVLSAPVSMIGIGIVLVLLGGYVTASIAMKYILMTLAGVPVVVLGLSLLITSADARFTALGLLITGAGGFLTLIGAYSTITSAPITVGMTLTGAAIITFAIREGRKHADFTSKRIHLVSSYQRDAGI